MRPLLALAIPVSLSYLGMMSMGLVDLILIGKLGKAATGAVGLGTSLFGWCLVLGTGLLSGMDYWVSSRFGAGKLEACGQTLVQGVVLATLLAIPLTLALYFLSWNLSILGIHPEVIDGAAVYLRTLCWSLWPALVFASHRNFFQAVDKAVVALWILLAANVLNAALNTAFIYGWGPIPAMGIQGSAWATGICRVCLAASALAYAGLWFRKNLSGEKLVFWNPEKLQGILRLGLPSSAQMCLEVGVFTLATVLAGTLIPEALAAHQIALNIASVTFMIPLGIGAATSVRVGQEVGRQEWSTVVRSGYQGLIIGSVFMALSCACILIFPQMLFGAYSHDSSVWDLARRLLIVVALFQLFDGIQTIVTGALRGIADTRSPLWVNLLGHWVVGLPLGMWLCFSLGKGVEGLWVGLASGLVLVAVVLLWVWYAKTKDVERLKERLNSPALRVDPVLDPR